ncbi:hypothetical protein A374_08689 [Fictibacillus macauensis ZFHKF-1]|uniref:DUF4376 domain-containing protein n=1 Tax=Fictibacillus macauensis ZFHKF-1 TaxID=1196324 RepID=I8AK21_9BACL|nr:hypothetical protein [Fictibacillus macauensis]EIT85899.1 hypothetical protein A374_08689 [Fictibacillus macauensis ZFHKF-1]
MDNNIITIHLWVRENGRIGGWSSTPQETTIPYDMPADDLFLRTDPYNYKMEDGKLVFDYEFYLQNEKEAKDREINDACNAEITAGFNHTINGVEYHFAFDMDAQFNFQAAERLLSKGLKKSIMWTVQIVSSGTGALGLGNYTRIPITLSIMDDLLVVIADHKEEKIAKYRDVLYPILQAATTVEEVRAITW